ncbi:MAG: HEPN domain-containing protein [Candidatus Edwardsbacteria bacterium]
MVDEKIIREWLNKAEEDFCFASLNLANHSNTFFTQICFHFQQAAEKYLKTYIVACELSFRRIHDLPELLKICQAHQSSFSKLKKACEFLTDFYVDTRYPVHWPTEISRDEAEMAQQMAGEIRDFVKGAIINHRKKRRRLQNIQGGS